MRNDKNTKIDRFFSVISSVLDGIFDTGIKLATIVFLCAILFQCSFNSDGDLSVSITLGNADSSEVEPVGDAPSNN